MRRAKNEWCQEKWQHYHQSMSDATQGIKNGNSFDVTNDQLFNCAVSLCHELQRPFLKTEWVRFAKQNNLPAFFVEFRLLPYKSLDEWRQAVFHAAGVGQS